MWMSNYATSYTIEEINDIRRHHTVTHVILEGDIPPDISTLFPHLTHLRLYNVDSNTDCTRYSVVMMVVFQQYCFSLQGLMRWLYSYLLLSILPVECELIM